MAGLPSPRRPTAAPGRTRQPPATVLQ